MVHRTDSPHRSIPLVASNPGGMARQYRKIYDALKVDLPSEDLEENEPECCEESTPPPADA